MTMKTVWRQRYMAAVKLAILCFSIIVIVVASTEWCYVFITKDGCVNMLDILFGCLDDLQKCPISKQPWVLYKFLHFAWGVDDSKCIVVTRVCVSCLSAAVRPHYCTDPGVTWGRGKGCPLVVHCWADLQSAHGLRCYGNNANPSLRGVCARCWLVTGGWWRRSQLCAPYIASGVARWPVTGRRRGGAFSTLLRRPGLRASNGGVLAT